MNSPRYWALTQVVSFNFDILIILVEMNSPRYWALTQPPEHLTRHPAPGGRNE